ncbi:MAG: tellurite resistance TerB family protein [Rhodospirillaceae bacterium]|nr:tellurite resistance TerB family protein [Rhodospirillaceae bacterium]
MAGFFDMVISHHKKNKTRAEKYGVFKASMAAAALLAMADGKRDLREDATLKALLKTLEDLKLYRTGDGTGMYSDFIGAIEKDGDAGRAEARDAIAAVKDDPEQAALVAAVCATVIRADGTVDHTEAQEMDQVCALLGLDAETISALDVDARDFIYD